MIQMMEELVPEDIKENIDLQKIGDAIWQYTLGEITAYNLTIEVAVSFLLDLPITSSHWHHVTNHKLSTTSPDLFRISG